MSKELAWKKHYFGVKLFHMSIFEKYLLIASFAVLIWWLVAR